MSLLKKKKKIKLISNPIHLLMYVLSLYMFNVHDEHMCMHIWFCVVGKAMVEGKKWYYFSRRTQNRVTASGYWKSCGGDEQIMSSNGSKRIGMKKYYVFHAGDQGMKTDWIMQEFRVCDGANSSRSGRRDNSKIVSHH